MKISLDRQGQSMKKRYCPHCGQGKTEKLYYGRYYCKNCSNHFKGKILKLGPYEIRLSFKYGVSNNYY